MRGCKWLKDSDITFISYLKLGVLQELDVSWGVNISDKGNKVLRKFSIISQLFSLFKKLIFFRNF